MRGIHINFSFQGLMFSLTVTLAWGCSTLGAARAARLLVPWTHPCFVPHVLKRLLQNLPLLQNLSLLQSTAQLCPGFVIQTSLLILLRCRDH